MKKQILSKIAYVIGIVLIAGLGLALIVNIEIKQQKESYIEALNNPPSIEEVEIQLKTILVAEVVEVTRSEQEGETIIYDVEVPIYGGYKKWQNYKVLYKIKFNKGEMYGYYKWEYESHRYISTTAPYDDLLQ